MIILVVEIKSKTFFKLFPGRKYAAMASGQDIPKELRSLRDLMTGELGGLYDPREARSLVEGLFYYLAGIGRMEFSLNPSAPVPGLLRDELLAALEELKTGKPLQYITGKAEFMGMTLEVDSRVLIPRPETEELVEWVIRQHQHDDALKVLDVGTGSGCIAIALSKNLPNSRVYAMDVSREAIGLAAENSTRHTAGVVFFAGDILEGPGCCPEEGFDVLVSNPPYVRESEIPMMQRNVTYFEPPGALYVPDEDPLKYYHAIASFALVMMREGGAVYVEINEGLGEACVQLFHNAGFRDVELRKDLHGRDRMVRAYT